MISHVTKIVPHSATGCNTTKCSTRFVMECSCRFGQGASCREEAEFIARGHADNPDAILIRWDNTPLTADTITDQQLRDLFARHCECRPLDLTMGERDHAALHDCDLSILMDVQIALGIYLFNDIGRVQALREARMRCAETINTERKGLH